MTRASFDRPFKTRFFRDAARAAALVTVVALALAAPAAAQPATFRVLPPANDAGPVTPVAVLGDDTRQPLQPEQIKHIRETTRVSQAVFARLLKTSLSTVQKWEIGQKKPTGTALKLLHLVQKRGLEVVA